MPNSRPASIHQSLTPYLRRVRILDIVTVGAFTAVACFAVATISMWLDSIWETPVAFRWLVTRIGPVIAVVAFGAVAWWKVRKHDYRSIALTVDDRAETGGEIIAGWQLEREIGAGIGATVNASFAEGGNVLSQRPLTQGLALLATQQAATRLVNLAPNALIPNARVKKASRVLLFCIGILLVLVVGMPSVVWHQTQRFLWPSADIPPLTGTIITLDPSEAEVRFGDDLLVGAHVSGDVVDRMQLILRRADGSEQTLPMLPQAGQRFQVILSRVTESLDLIAKSGRARSAAGRLTVRMTPEIVSSHVRIVPPDYTRRAVYAGKIPKDGISGLRETKVTFSIQSNRPLAHGLVTLTFRDGSSENIRLEPIDDANESEPVTVRGTLTLSNPGKFRIQVTDRDGIESKETVEGTIQITIDQRPIIRILEPRPNSVATPDVELPIQIMAEDDYGISSLRLYRSINGSNATFEAFEIDGGARQLVQTSLPLMQYRLEAGDELQFFARTEDNDPAGLKGAESPISRVHIISVEDFQQMLVQQDGADSIAAKYEAAQRHLENLAEAVREAMQRSESGDNSKESVDAAHDALEKAKNAADEAARQLKQLANQAMPLDVDQALAEELRKTAQEMASIAEELQEMSEDVVANQEVPNDERLEEMKKILKSIQNERDEIQDKAIDPLATMQATLPLQEDQSRFEELAQRQRELAERIASTTNETNADKQQLARRIAELESQQESLKQEIEQLLESIEAHADALPQDPDLDKLRETSMKFADALRKADVPKPMGDAQQRLLEDRLKDAAQQASEAANRLERLLQDSNDPENNMAQQGRQACQAAFNPKRNRPDLGRTLDQLRKMMQKKSSGQGQGGQRPGNGQQQGGYSQKTGGKSNFGMYGNMPQQKQAKGGGRGDKKSKGMEVNSSSNSVGKGNAIPEANQANTASGQSMNAIPSQYRSKVSEFYRRVTEKLGDQEGNNEP